MVMVVATDSGGDDDDRDDDNTDLTKFLIHPLPLILTHETQFKNSIESQHSMHKFQSKSLILRDLLDLF